MINRLKGVLPSTSHLVILIIFSNIITQSASQLIDPNFKSSIANVTVPVGREAILSCVVQDLAGYKVAWLRVDTQTILTIANHVITKNHRIGVTHSDHRTWFLHIREVRETDRGWYMCQINTDPMKSQTGFLDVVVPPDIIDHETSADMVVREGSNVTLRCSATGSPKPSITWRREDNQVFIENDQEVRSIEGSSFRITRVNRSHMGSYLCIASNGVPPSVSKRIMLIVHFAPMISIQNQLVGAKVGQMMTLECSSEAFPKSINYWTKNKAEIIAQDGKYEPILIDNAYKVQMKLTIRSVTPDDFDTYKCVSRNSLGDTDGSIKLYEITNDELEVRGKLKKNLNDNLLDTNQEEMLKERDLKLRGRKNSDEDEEDYDDSGSSTTVTTTNLITNLVIIILTLFSNFYYHHPHLEPA